jgi:uncharacterized protein (TIGR02996 family)
MSEDNSTNGPLALAGACVRMDGQAFCTALDENPGDWTTRLVYADWLEEDGEPDLAAAQRWMVGRQKYPPAFVAWDFHYEDNEEYQAWGGRWPRVPTERAAVWRSEGYNWRPEVGHSVLPRTLWRALAARAYPSLRGRKWYSTRHLAELDLALALNKGRR